MKHMATRLVRNIRVRRWRRCRWTQRHSLNGASITSNWMGVTCPRLCLNWAILISVTCWMPPVVPWSTLAVGQHTNNLLAFKYSNVRICFKFFCLNVLNVRWTSRPLLKLATCGAYGTILTTLGPVCRQSSTSWPQTKTGWFLLPVLVNGMTQTW